MSALVRALLGLVAVLAAPAAQALTPPPPEPPVFFGLRFPETVAGFPRGEAVDYEKDRPGLGYAVKYSDDGWAIDVYIYDAGLKDVPESLAAGPVTREFLAARRGVLRRARAGKTRVVEKDAFRIVAPDETVRFICRAYSIRSNGRQIDSYLCLTTWNGKFVKYRLSTHHADGSIAVAKRFVGGWIGVLWPDPPALRPGMRRAMLGTGT